MTAPRAPHVFNEIRSPENGQLDARLTAQTLGLSLPQLGQVLNYGPRDLAQQPTSDGLQSALEPFEALALHLWEVFGSLETGRRWLRASTPVLAEEAPVDYLLRGDLVTLQKLLRMAENGMPT